MNLGTFPAQLLGHGLKVYSLVDRALRVILGETNAALVRKADRCDGLTVVTIIVRGWIGKSSLRVILKTKERAKA